MSRSISEINYLNRICCAECMMPYVHIPEAICFAGRKISAMRNFAARRFLASLEILRPASHIASGIVRDDGNTGIDGDRTHKFVIWSLGDD